MARSRTWVSTFVILLVVIGAGTAGGWMYFRDKKEAPPRIQTATVQRGSITQSVTATGQLETVIKTDVSSQISGRIVEVMVDFNSPVKQGDVLARLDPATYEAAVIQAENELLNAKANFRLVRANADRSQILFKQKLVSEAELDEIQAQLEQAQVQIRIREAALESRRTDLSRCTLYAPIDGIVIDRLAEVGKTVAASLNAPTLFTIVNDLTKMQINASVAEADIGNVKVNQEVEFTVDAFPGERFKGRVTQIRNLPVTQQNVVVYATIIEVSNEHMKLKPGMTANVEVIIERRENALRVPNAALRVRVPENYLVQQPTDGAAPATAEAAPPADPREQFRALMREAGWDPSSGRPTPDILEKARQLAAQRGIELPDPGSFGPRGGDGSRPPRAASSSGGATRTVYRLLETGPQPKLEAGTVRLGITDGSTTEVLSGLKEDEEIVTSFIVPGASAAAAAPARSGPLSGGRRF